ncbi:MAG: redoxin domain-containing protein [Planctomycetes bacterium]|nr:redoxin domain-containing protein [Planctomycetota bacterium]
MVRLLPLTRVRPLLVALLLSVGFMPAAQAENAPPFPTDPNSWINSGPLSVSALKGKGIVLWFFEEEDPATQALWSELMISAKKYETKPVLFIAVNSGNPKAKIEVYIRQAKVTWPVIVDTSRGFEKACGLFQEINAQNVSGIRYIKPDGEIVAGLDDLEDAADNAVEGAEWKIDPAGIPESLKSAWHAIEFGNYKGLAVTLNKSAKSSKSDVKEAAAKLMEVVQKEIETLAAEVKETQDNMQNYRAYELYSELTERFSGFELPKDVVAMKKDFSKDPKVKAGMAAAKSLEVARKQLVTGNPAMKTKTLAALEKIMVDFPDTSLAQQAKTLIEYSGK